MFPKKARRERQLAVERYLSGESVDMICSSLKRSRRWFFTWLARYRSGGWHALRTGKQSGRPKKLNGKQIAWIYRTIRDKTPQQLKFPFALWTRALVVRLIKNKFGIKLSESSVGRLFRQFVNTWTLFQC